MIPVITISNSKVRDIIFLFTILTVWTKTIRTHKNYVRAEDEVKILNSCPNDHMSEAVTSSYYCQPIQKILKLNMPQNISFTQMSPSHISVNQCGGGCHNTDHSCVSISKIFKTIPVILSRCGLSSGRCTKVCAIATVTEDTRCQCQCPKSDCDPSLHFHNDHTCQCQCKQEKEHILCREQERFWDHKTCKCMCPPHSVRPCSTGLVFDFESTCSCVSELDDSFNNSIIDIDTRVSRSDGITFNDNNLHNIIIITLSLVSTVFFIIIINLVRTINKLRSSIRTYKNE